MFMRKTSNAHRVEPMSQLASRVTAHPLVAHGREWGPGAATGPEGSVRRLKSVARRSCVLASLAGLLSMSACAENRTTLFIERGLYIPPEDDCLISVDLNGLQSGVMDLDLTNSYSASVSVANQMQPLGDPDRLRAETSRIQLEGFEVEIEGIDATPAVTTYSRRFTSIVDPGNGTDPGRTAVTLDMIPGGAITEEGFYLIHVRIYGTTLGGLEVESPEFVYPLQVCEGCLLTCAEEAGPACGFNFGNDYPVSCEFYGGAACQNNCGR